MTRLGMAIGAWLVAAVLARTVVAQEEGLRVADQSRRADLVYKNIQVLKEATAGEVQGAMSFMSEALGVRCDHCHARGFERDDKPAKQAARRMIQMVQLLNDDHFEGERKVTCYTCHHGEVEPATVPAIGDAGPRFGDPQSGDPSSKMLPTASTVLSKWVEAIGGEVAVSKVTALAIKGTEPSPQGGTVAFEEMLAKSGSSAAHHRVWWSGGAGNRAMTRGFDGNAGWMAQPGRVRALSGERLAALRMETDLIENLDLEARLESLKVIGKQRIAGHDAFAVVGAPKQADVGSMPCEREQLFFDVKSGLLLRRVRELHTVLGPLPMATDYEDYRAASGVQFPFKRRTAGERGDHVQTIEQLVVNPQVTDAKFAPPSG